MKPNPLCRVLLVITIALAVVIYIRRPSTTRPELDAGIPIFPSSPIRFTHSPLDDFRQLEPEVWALLGGEGEVPGPEDVPHEMQISNVQIVDLVGDSHPEILVCDCAANHIRMYVKESSEWTPTLIASDLKTPAHATVVDLDGDEDMDIVVSILGHILPSDEVIGAVVLLTNEDGRFTRSTLLDNVRRVADVQPGDFNQDGKLDLAVAVFGYARGEVLWLEQVEAMKFEEHFISARPGVIHVPVRDYDNDGDMDIATIVSQDEEEVWIYENSGTGAFTSHRVYYTHNFDVGAGGLVATDLDKDGDWDFLIAQGDNLEYGHGWPQPYHGCLWLENKGNFEFEPHQIGQLGGTYAVAAEDMDSDGDMDVVMVSMSNDASNPKHPTVVWLENNGSNEFEKSWTIATKPTELICVACGDVNADGRMDIVAGRLRVPLSSSVAEHPVNLWINEGR